MPSLIRLRTASRSSRESAASRPERSTIRLAATSSTVPPDVCAPGSVATASACRHDPVERARLCRVPRGKRRADQNGGVTRPAPAVAVPLVLVPALGLAQGGFSPDTWVWAGALAAWGAAIAVVLGDGGGAIARAWPWVCLTTGLLCWTLASTLWSAHAAQSVLDGRRTACYAAVLLALVTLARRGSTRALVLATHVAVTAVVVYALARYLLGPHRQREFEDYLLSEPLGYANAIGILAVLGILLGLGVAARATSKGRAAAMATVPPLAAALELSGSRASWPALGAGLGVALLL